MYGLLNVPLNAHTRGVCEHDGAPWGPPLGVACPAAAWLQLLALPRQLCGNRLPPAPVAAPAGAFNMLLPALAHMGAVQQGQGVIAVSQRYAERARAKFSMLWGLPPAAVTGILNGLEDSARPAAARGAADDPEAFFQRKAEAKLELQAAKGLQASEAGQRD